MHSGRKWDKKVSYVIIISDANNLNDYFYVSTIHIWRRVYIALFAQLNRNWANNKSTIITDCLLTIKLQRVEDAAIKKIPFLYLGRSKSCNKMGVLLTDFTVHTDIFFLETINYPKWIPDTVQCASYLAVFLDYVK